MTSRDDKDSTLRALGEEARAESSDAVADERWEAVAGGRATEAERAALARAAEEGGFDPAETRALFEPLGSASRERLVELALAELGKARATAPASAAPRPESVAQDAQDVPATRASASLRLRRGGGALLTAVALAAGVALVLGRERAQDGSFAPVPAYELTLAGGTAETRGGPPEPLALTRGSSLVATLRPATRVEGPVEARAYLARGQQLYPLDLQATITPDGAIRLSGRLAELPGSEGPAELVVSVVRPGTAHDPLGAPSPGAQRVRRPVRLGAVR